MKVVSREHAQNTVKTTLVNIFPTRDVLQSGRMKLPDTSYEDMFNYFVFFSELTGLLSTET